jgi:hypothetical protein
VQPVAGEALNNFGMPKPERGALAAWRATLLAPLVFVHAAYDPKCPCVNVSLRTSLPVDGSKCGSELEYTPKIGVDAKSYCYPEAYGSGTCSTWDEGLEPLCGNSTASLPGWCKEEWCYIDIDVCKLSKHSIQRSDFFPDEPNLFFSYSTCRRGTTYGIESAQSALAKPRKLVVAIPALQVPQHYKVNNITGEIIEIEDDVIYEIPQTRHGPSYRQPHVENEFKGAIIMYFQELEKGGFAAKHNITGFEFTWVSAGAREWEKEEYDTDSGWTAAVYEVSQGLADMAGSTFWRTANRELMSKKSTFTTSIGLDSFYLWVRRPESTRYSQLTKVFAPFDRNLWLSIVSALLLGLVGNMYLMRDEVIMDPGVKQIEEERILDAKRKLRRLAKGLAGFLNQQGSEIANEDRPATEKDDSFEAENSEGEVHAKRNQQDMEIANEDLHATEKNDSLEAKNSEGTFHVNDRVEALDVKAAKYLPARITAENPDGTYTVRYVNGDLEGDVPARHIRTTVGEVGDWGFTIASLLAFAFAYAWSFHFGISFVFAVASGLAFATVSIFANWTTAGHCLWTAGHGIRLLGPGETGIGLLDPGSRARAQVCRCGIGIAFALASALAFSFARQTLPADASTTTTTTTTTTSTTTPIEFPTNTAWTMMTTAPLIPTTASTALASGLAFGLALASGIILCSSFAHWALDVLGSVFRLCLSVAECVAKFFVAKFVKCGMFMSYVFLPPAVLSELFRLYKGFRWFSNLKSDHKVKFGAICLRHGFSVFETVNTNFMYLTVNEASKAVQNKMGNGSNDKSIQKLLARLGFTFFVIVVISGYTANLAAFLTVENDQGSFPNSLRAAIQQQVVICVEGNAYDKLMQEDDVDGIKGYKHFKHVTYGYLPKDFISNECDAVVWPIRLIEDEPVDAAFMCEQNLMAVEVVFQLELAFPVRVEVASAVSAAITEQRSHSQTTYRSLVRDLGFFNGTGCPYKDSLSWDFSMGRAVPTRTTYLGWKDLPSDVEVDLKPLTAWNLTTPIAVWFLCLFIALFAKPTAREVVEAAEHITGCDLDFDGSVAEGHGVRNMGGNKLEVKSWTRSMDAKIHAMIDAKIQGMMAAGNEPSYPRSIPSQNRPIPEASRSIPEEVPIFDKAVLEHVDDDDDDDEAAVDKAVLEAAAAAHDGHTVQHVHVNLTI